MSGKAKCNTVELYERAFDLIQRLQAGQRLSAPTIAETYSISHRSAYRIMNSLEAALPVRRIGGQGMEGSYLVLRKGKL